jgi:transcription antitermination factor NusG
MERWYALQIRPQRELSVLEALVDRQVLTFWPSYRVKQGQRYVRKSLFPGYLFARLDLEDKNHPAVSVPNVIRIVGAKGPTPIPDEEIAQVRSIAQMPSARPERLTDLKVGQAVRVSIGPLAGLYGYVVYLKNSTRIVVSMGLLGQAASAEVDLDAVEAVRQEAA